MMYVAIFIYLHSCDLLVGLSPVGSCCRYDKGMISSYNWLWGDYVVLTQLILSSFVIFERAMMMMMNLAFIVDDSFVSRESMMSIVVTNCVTF